MKKIIFLEGKDVEQVHKKTISKHVKGRGNYYVSRIHSNMGYYKNEREKWICFDNRDGEMYTSVEPTDEDCLRWLTQRADNEVVR